MRKQQLTMFVSVLVFTVAAVAAAAQTPAVQPAGQRSELERVNVVRGTDDIRVEISSRGVVTPKLSALDSPARVIVDLPETAMAAGRTHIPVGSAGVKDVRIGTDGQTPPTTRIVVDLNQACAYELTPGPAGRLVLTLHTQTAARQTSAPTVAKIATPAASPSAAPKAAVTATAEATPAATPKDYVFVEPTYQAKTDAPKTSDVSKNDQPAAEPTVRAQAAAERFSDKTAAELLPVSIHSAQQASGNNPTITPAVNLAAEQRAQVGQQPAAVGPKYTGEPISVNLKDVDLKDFFRLIHEISGLNVVLDPNVKGTLTVVLDDVPWDQALDIVLKNNDLARQLDGNVLRIATVETLRHEAESRRAEQEAEALAGVKQTVTRFLSYAHSKDVIMTLKKFLSQRGDAVADERTNAVIISDIPAVMPNIDRLLTQLDRKTQEVEIEARVVAATRSFAREISTQLGFGFGNAATAVGGASAAGTSPLPPFGIIPRYPIIGTSAPTPTTPIQIPLFSNLGATDPTSGFSF